jgi:hydroxymethylpyrimidine pyrophosphatase-like HAD family hydrolase
MHTTPPSAPNAPEPNEFASKRLILATDLDGTFLGGTTTARAELYGWIEANRASVGLIFVTGRDLGFIETLTNDGKVPRPDYVVGDVGTTIAVADGSAGFTPIAALESEIAARWDNAGGRVRDALADVGGLTPQPTEFRYRVSYDMNPARFEPRASDIVAEMGLDALISDNRFFDVLPRGVSKGPSLRRLLAALGIADPQVLVAGDTLNDLSMLTLGLPAVAVGNSEAALVEQLADHAHVHHAEAAGAAGIAEAIRRFGYLSRNAA